MERKVPALAGLNDDSSNEERKQVAFETLYKIRNVTIATETGINQLHVPMIVPNWMMATSTLRLSLVNPVTSRFRRTRIS